MVGCRPKVGELIPSGSFQSFFKEPRHDILSRFGDIDNYL